jgi:hypothetical protein
VICIGEWPGEHSLGAFPLRCNYCKAHAAGKREGIEAAARAVGDKAVRLRERAQAAWEARARDNADSLSVHAAALEDVGADIRALLQTEARGETGEGK